MRTTHQIFIPIFVLFVIFSSHESPPPPAAVKSTNSLAILVLLQGSSHESHCTILVPHLQVDDKGATDEEDGAIVVGSDADWF